MLLSETRRGLPYSLWGLYHQPGLPGCLVRVARHWGTPIYRSSSLKIFRYTTYVRRRPPLPAGKSPPERTGAAPQPSTRFYSRSHDHTHPSGTSTDHTHRVGVTIRIMNLLVYTQTYRLKVNSRRREASQEHTVEASHARPCASAAAPLPPTPSVRALGPVLRSLLPSQPPPRPDSC